MNTGTLLGCVFANVFGGKLTNRKKKLEPGKGVFGCAIGSNALYEWLDDNPGVAAYPLEYVNRPSVIAQIYHMVSINSCVAVDLYGRWQQRVPESDRLAEPADS